MNNMTDQEMIDAVAIEVMELTLDKPKSYLPGVWRDKSGNWIGMESGDDMFNPLIDANHWMMVVERMRELGYHLCLDATGNGYGARYWIYEDEPTPLEYIFDEQPGHAVCLAALQAVRGKKCTQTDITK